MLEHPRGKSPQQVDHHNDQASDGIAFDELHRAIHGAEQLALARQLFTLVARLPTVDQAGTQVTVDGHLLARHCVQAEARRHFGNPLRALGDHQKVDQGEDQEDHHPNSQVAAHYEVAEGLNDIAGVLFEQNQARRSDRQCQPKHGGQQQNRREGRERQRPGQVQRQHDQQAGNTDIQRNQNVHQPGRQRHDEDEHNGHDHHGAQDLGALRYLEQYAVDGGQHVHARILELGKPGLMPSRRASSSITSRKLCSASWRDWLSGHKARGNFRNSG